MIERNDRYEEDNYYRREERDDPNEMDRDESLNECLLEIARLANDARALTVRAPREFVIAWDDGDERAYFENIKCAGSYDHCIKVREVL